MSIEGGPEEIGNKEGRKTSQQAIGIGQEEKRGGPVQGRVDEEERVISI